MNEIARREVGSFSFVFYSDGMMRQIRLFVGDRQLYCTTLFGQSRETLQQMIMLCFAAATEEMSRTSREFVAALNQLERECRGRDTAENSVL